MRFSGPLVRGETESIRPVRGACRTHARFRQFKDELSKTPAPTHEPAQRARTRGVLLFGSVSLGQAREMNSVAEGERKLLNHNMQKRNPALTGKPHLV